MTDTTPPSLMDLLEKYVTTATRASAYGLIGVFGARYHYQVRGGTDPFVYVFGWAGLGTIFVIAVSLNLWALVRADKDLQDWGAGDGWRRVGGFLIFGGLLAATAAIWFQVPGILTHSIE